MARSSARMASACSRVISSFPCGEAFSFALGEVVRRTSLVGGSCAEANAITETTIPTSIFTGVRLTWFMGKDSSFWPEMQHRRHSSEGQHATFEYQFRL